MANWKGMRESTNFEDRTAAPWYDYHKLTANVMIGFNRLVGDKKQAELDAVQKARDANPLPVQTPQQRQADFNARVSRADSGSGWNINRSGAEFQEYAPDYVDMKTVNEILKNSGLQK